MQYAAISIGQGWTFYRKGAQKPTFLKPLGARKRPGARDRNRLTFLSCTRYHV